MPTDAESLLRPSAEQAIAAYRELILAASEQAQRTVERAPGGEDFWKGRLPSFLPGAMDSPEWEFIAALAEPGATWLDIGAGAGRLTLPLSERVGKVIAIEPAPVMREALLEATASRENVEILDLRWPPEGGDGPRGDVALASHILYDNQDLGSFIETTEARAAKVVLVMGNRPAIAPDPALWEELHGEPYRAMPGARELQAVVRAMGRRINVRTTPLAPRDPVAIEQGHERMRWRYGVAPGSARDARLRDLLVEHYGTADGLLALPPQRAYAAVIWWDAPARD